MEYPNLDSNPDPNLDKVEAYAMGRLSAAELASFEEHLLTCPACQDAVQAEDRYQLAMRTALRTPIPATEKEHSRFGWNFGWPGLAWAGGLAMVVVGLLAVPWGSPPATPVAVTLSSFRGAQPVAMAHAPAGSPLNLGIDSVAATAECRIEIVNASGEPKWNGALTATTAGLQARVEKGLAAGQYWVRLYAPDAQLLQEFGLRLD